MSVTTSNRLNGDQLIAALPAGTYFNGTGATLESNGSKTLTGLNGLNDATLQAAVDAASASFVDRTANESALRTKAQQALTTNAAYLAIPAPTATEVRSQTELLTREVNGLIRLLLGQLDDISDT